MKRSMKNTICLAYDLRTAGISLSPRVSPSNYPSCGQTRGSLTNSESVAGDSRRKIYILEFPDRNVHACRMRAVHQIPNRVSFNEDYII